MRFGRLRSASPFHAIRDRLKILEALPDVVPLAYAPETDHVHWLPLDGDEISQPLLECVHPEDFLALREYLLRLASEPSLLEARELRFRGDPKSYPKWHTLSPLSLRDDGRVYGLLRDINARKHEELIARETQLVGKIGGWEFDIDRRMLLWSSGTHTIFENDPDGEPPAFEYFETLFEGESRAVFRRAIDRLLGAHLPFDERLECVSLRGRSLHVRLLGHVELDGPTPKRLYGTIQDISQEAASKAELDRQKRRLEFILTYSPALIFAKDTAGRVILSNKRFEEVLRRPREDIISESEADLLPPHLCAIQKHNDRIVIDSKVPLSFEERLPTPDGKEELHLSTKFPLFDEKGNIVAVGCISTNVHHQRAAEHALRQQSEALNAQMLVLNLDEDGTIIFANRIFRELLGYAEGELLGMRFGDLESGNADPRSFESIRDAALAGKAWREILGSRKKSGERIWLDTTVMPMRDPAGRVTHYATIHYDVTAERKAHEELVRAKEEAVAGTRAKSEFLANMSHEIRTPMNSILGLSDLLLETPLDGNQRKFVTTLNRASQNLMRLINDILDLSKVESGALTLEEETFELRELVERSIELLSLRAQEKGIHLHSEFADDFPAAWVVGDPGRVRQIMLNLLGNALKFTERGEIALAVLATGADGEFAFEVRDTGIGMTQEQMQRLFERFSQADSSITRRYGGSGLGLSITKRLVEMMGGKISVRSEFGQGTAFRFNLKLKPGAALAPPTRIGKPEILARARANPLSVLLVDDHEDNRMLVTHALEREPCRIETAENGVQALQKLQDQAFDLILMDMQMPIMDGFTATRSIREIERAQGLPPTFIVALTAHAMKEERDRTFAVGCDRHLSKPVHKAELLEALALAAARAAERGKKAA